MVDRALGFGSFAATDSAEALTRIRAVLPPRMDEVADVVLHLATRV